MRHFLRVVLLGLLPAIAFATGDANSAGPVNATQKLDPSLRAHLQRRPSNELVPLYVKTPNAAKTRALVRALGGTTGALAGDILTARVPQRSLAKLAGSRDISRLEGAQRVGQKLDKVLPAMKADQVHSGAAGSPFKGTGVVVGIVDFGLDLKHSAFKKADGGTRIIALWDQSGTGASPFELGYGAECTTAALAGGTCAHKTTNEHGTHVTGVAAGAPVGGQFSGVAPEADIAFVSVGAFPPGIDDPYDAISVALCDAAAYVFEIARLAGKAAVVNLSVGNHAGPHDGSSLAEQCLDNLTGPGRIIVAAAGNEGVGGSSATTTKERVALHTQLTAAATPSTVGFLASFRGTVDVGVWFDAPTNVSVRVGAKQGTGAPVFTGVATLAKPLDAAPLAAFGKNLGPVFVGTIDGPSGAKGFDIRIFDENADKSELNDVTWVLEVTGTGKVDAFIDTTFNGGFRLTDKSDGVVVDNEMSIGYPAIANEVIAVGSYITKPEWTSIDASIGGRKRVDLATGQPVVLGAISSFSSHGPPRSTAVVKGPKPDIVAPGETVASAMHNDINVTASDVVKAKPDGYYVSAGTSIAAPAAAGAIALMLQKNPKLTTAQIRTVLDTTSVLPAGVTAPSPIWGRGQLDALAAVKATPLPDPNAPGPGGPGGGADGGAGAAPPSDEGCSITTPGADSRPFGWWSFAVLALALTFRARPRRANNP